MSKSVENRIKAQEILATNKPADLKLFEIFQIYKEDLQKDYTELYYALLDWKDTHLKVLNKFERMLDYEFVQHDDGV